MTNASATNPATSGPNAGSGASALLPYLSALPLIVAALMTLAAGDALAADARRFMVVYGGLLIAFFGGVRWGVAVMRPGGPTLLSLVGAAAPLVIALPVFFLQSDLSAFILIMVALPALLADDLRATRRGSGAPEWYLGVRTPLTVLMLVAYLVALVQQLAA
jgi:hypothetical protein